MRYYDNSDDENTFKNDTKTNNLNNVSQNQTSLNDEIMILDEVIQTLELTMDKYIDDVEMIWDARIVPFINSNDCMTLGKLNDNDFLKFLNFMLEQKTFKLMSISHKRLNGRKKYLLSPSV